MTSVGETFDPAALVELPLAAELLSPRTARILEGRRSLPSYKRRGWIVRRALLAADLAGLSLSFLGAELLRGLGRRGMFGSASEVLLFAAAIPVWLLLAKVYGLYDQDEERADHSTTDEITGVFNMITLSIWAAFALAWATKVAAPETGKLVFFWLFAVLLVPLGRTAARAACRRHLLYIQNTIVFGSGRFGRQVALRCLSHPEYGINVVGFVDTAPPEPEPGLESVAYLAGPERFAELVELLDVERVIVVFPQLEQDAVLGTIRALAEADVHVDIVPRYFDVVSRGSSFHGIEGIPLIALPPPRLSRSSRALKRAFDIVVSSLALLLLSPLLPIVIWRIRRESPGTVLFRQERMGAGDKPFQILKFRTMVRDAAARKAELAHLNQYANGGNGGGPMFKAPGDPRVTRFGRVLRSHFVDELPQLVNVLRGEMSLVGPRPLVLDEDEHVDDWRRRRLLVKPGMTGSWQVLGRNDIGFEEMLRLDYLYVNTWSLWQDCRLILRTVPLVLRGERRQL